MASNLSAIFDAFDVSSTLFVNFIEMASISISGFDFLINERIRVESTPPLSAMHNFLGFSNSRFLEISFKIKSSITSVFGIILFGLKSTQVFLSKFGIIDESYRSVRISTID